MTSITVDIDLEDYLDEVDTDYLVAELEDRGKKIVGVTEIVSASRDVANRLRSAFYRRDASTFEALLIAYLDPIEVKKPTEARAAHAGDAA